MTAIYTILFLATLGTWLYAKDYEKQGYGKGLREFLEKDNKKNKR